MDRPLDANFLRQRTWKRVGGFLGTVVVLVAVFAWGPGLIRPSISRERIRTAKVDAGPIEAVITASGVVLPEVEQVVSAPTDARVIRILHRPGATIAAGDRLVELDTSQSALAVEKLTRDVALKANAQERTRIDLERSLNDLDSQAKIKALQLESHRSQLARSRQLHKEGLLSEELLRQAEYAEAQATIELEKIQKERDNARRANQAQLAGLDLEMATVRNEVNEARRQLGLAGLKADRPGVLTWALTEEGVTIRKGDIVARIADLSSFRVEATLSDVHAKRVSAGLPVHVIVGEESVAGTVITVLPTIQNGAMTVQVALDQKSHPQLRSNLRVDVLVVTGQRARTLRIRKGPFADGEGRRDVFVIRGNRAYRTKVELGLAGFDRFEVVSGLAAGDEVILSDMREYLHLEELGIK